MTKIKNVYSTVPTDKLLNKDEEPEHRQPILYFLKENKGKFYTARQIAKECSFPIGGTQVAVRKAITLLIEIDGEPIASNAKGFGYCISAGQMRFYADRLEERKQGLQRRIDKVRQIAEEMRGGRV